MIGAGNIYKYVGGNVMHSKIRDSMIVNRCSKMIND